jgi:structural maintenance of chromosome 2
MWLTEVIIDGFKSYAAREVVSGFDMSFNAITGLNGTGKSNILDAICFVLGITNLTQVSYNFMHLLGPDSTYSIFPANVHSIFAGSSEQFAAARLQARPSGRHQSERNVGLQQ